MRQNFLCAIKGDLNAGDLYARLNIILEVLIFYLSIFNAGKS